MTAKRLFSRGLKVYVGAKYCERGTAKRLMMALEAQGHTITVDWIGSPQYIQTAQRMMAKLAHQKNARLRTWVSEPLYHLLKNTSCTATAVADLGIATRSTIDLTSVKEQPWWWMAGDTDFL